ncbi:MAG: hypothetical protein ACJAXT_000862, partial [Paracoccaceae bacterium]
CNLSFAAPTVWRKHLLGMNYLHRYNSVDKNM